MNDACAAPVVPRRTRTRCWWAALSMVSGLVGCAVGPDYVRPELTLPTQWRTAEAHAEPVAEWAHLAWWQSFGDPTLDGLVQQALQNNQDLKVAVARVRQYMARQDFSRAEQLPEVAVQGRSARDKLSEQRQAPLSPQTPVSSAAYELQGKVSWELDLWGRVQRSNEAALADLLAVEANRQAIALTLVSEVVTSYVDLLALDRDLALAHAQLTNRRDNLKLLESRQRSGGSSLLPVAQARIGVQEAEAAIPAKEREIASKENALSVLLGMRPTGISRATALAALRMPAVPAGLPSDVMAQRPDIRQAEQNLVAANARIGVAKAEYFPRLSLTGAYGFASTDLSRFLIGPATFGTAGTDLLAKVFDGGRIEANVAEAEALRAQQLETYRQKVLNAFREVEDALISHRKAVERDALLSQQQTDAQALVQLTRKRLEGGLGTRFDVLDAERTALAADVAQAQARHDVQASLVLIYKSMGGGWQLAAPEMVAAASAPHLESTAESVVHE